MLRLKQKRKEKEEAEARAKLEAEAAAAAAAEGGGSGAAAGAGAAADDSKTDDAPAKIGGIFGPGRGARGAGRESSGRAMKPAVLRVMKDVEDLDGGKIANVTYPDPGNMCRMECVVTPDQGYWKGASFLFTINVPDAYPHSAPKIYHPNIDLEGHVCLNILRDEWKPVFTINTVVYGIIYLFYEPNPNDPLNHEAAALFRSDINQFTRNVQRSLRGGSVDGTSFPKLL